MSPDFRSLPLGSLNSGESSYLKVRHGVALRGDRRGRSSNTFNSAADGIPKKLRPPLSWLIVNGAKLLWAPAHS